MCCYSCANVGVVDDDNDNNNGYNLDLTTTATAANTTFIVVVVVVVVNLFPHMYYSCKYIKAYKYLPIWLHFKNAKKKMKFWEKNFFFCSFNFLKQF